MFEEHQQIVLITEVSGDDGTQLKPGDVGVIVHVHPGGEALVVEFMSFDGDTLAIATVLSCQARPVTGADLTHARDIETVAGRYTALVELTSQFKSDTLSHSLKKLAAAFSTSN